MKIYWSRCARDRNVGDQLGPAILRAYDPTLRIRWAQARRADVIACGSIIDAVPEGWAGTVLNAGTLHAGTRRSLTGPVLSLRGPLTAQAVGVDPASVPLGDLGILAPRIRWVGRSDTDGTVVIPHYIDRDLTARWPDALHARMTDPVPEVVGTIATAGRVVSSSLHALILADAFGIPHRWEPHQKVVGDGHKFADYAAATGCPLRPYEWRLSPRVTIRQMTDRLDETVRRFLTEASP